MTVDIAYNLIHSGFLKSDRGTQLTFHLIEIDVCQK